MILSYIKLFFIWECKVGKFTHLGTGSSVHPGILIGNNVKVTVGSKVFTNIPNNTIYK